MCGRKAMNTAAAPSSQTLCHLELAQAAVLAPSADNNQPWRFVSEGDRLLIYLDPQRTLPSDVNAMYDLAGLGAAVENMCIAARQLGYEPQVDHPPGPTSSTGEGPLRLVATMTFALGGSPDPLFPHLAARCTCRKLYSTRPAADGCLEKLADAAQEFGSIQVDWVTERTGIRAFARLIAMSDRFRFQYEPFHKEIFRQLRFSAEEAERTRDGLDLRTLELPPAAGALLRLLRPWKRMQLINRLGLGRALTLPSALSVWKSGTLGVLSLPEASSEGFFQGGRALERIWLGAEAEGLAFQPLGSLPIFLAQVEQYQGRNLTPRHQQLSTRLGQWLRQLVPTVVGRTLLMVFRLGYASPPRVRSLRRAAEEVFDYQ
jgi:nitroreductase